MIDANRLLLNEILKRNFNYIITIVNNKGEEEQLILKKKKREFLKQLGDLNVHVVLVDNYPRRDDWEFGVFYLTKNGECLFYKEKEGKQLEF